MAQKEIKKETNQHKTRILIVDDHPIVREGLAKLIDQEKDMAVCGQAEDAHQAIKAIKTLNPDLVIVDISLKETSGMDLIKDIKAQHTKLPVLTLSMHDESLYAERALRAGAQGYIMKQEAPERVVAAIRTVLAGKLYISDKVTSRMVHKLVGSKTDHAAAGVDALSDRELEVFLLIGQGFGTRQIAEKLFLSPKTIETYRAHIKEKLGVADATELLQYAIQWVSSHEDK
ncbi:MAG TPA: response regulator transcription factor [Sedimentisphaerales bacterium]|nr:response regulator transcription factor [Sedimentisphaerales bacterium]